MLEWQPNAEGIFYDLPDETYHAAPGVSNSMLKHLEPTPAHLQAYLAEKHEPTPAMILGTLVHHIILQPERPFPRLAIKPADMKFSTREGKAWRDEQAGKLIITQADYDALIGWVLSVAAHPVCREIFKEGEREVSLFRRIQMDEGSCLRKARIDFMPFGNSLIDIKTTLDASPRAFAKTIYDMRYYRQAAYYLDLANDAAGLGEKECFLFVAVEKTPPYLVAVYNLDREALDKGREENAAALRTYIQCTERNEWPGYPEQITAIGLPAWAIKKML